METRKITIISTKSNSKSVIETNATTLAELKSALNAANIDYTDMSFYEGLTKTELVNDESVLPHDVNYKGTVTNELVFMLTNTNKKIKSGSERTDLYDFIRIHNLQDAVIVEFGKNFTTVKTSDLAEFVAKHQDEKPVKKECNECSTGLTILDNLFEELYASEMISKELYDQWKDWYEEEEEDNDDNSNQSPYSDKDINEMFGKMF